MINNYIYGILIAIILGAGCMATYTDIKEGKIYNKHLLIFFLMAIVLQVIYLSSKNQDVVKGYLINLAASIIFSLSIYCFKIWAAGDAKLLILIMSLMPLEVYKINNMNVFPGFSIIMYIFLCGFIYVALESMFLYVKDKFIKREISSMYCIDIKLLKNLAPKLIFAWVISINVNFVLSKYFKVFYFYNLSLCMLFNALLIVYLARYIGNKIIFSFVLVLGGSIYIYNFINSSITNVNVNLKVMALVIILIFLRTLCGKYNYKKITIENLKTGMILSAGTVLSFNGSRVKGLPVDASESMNSRINEEQINSIRRWHKSSRGFDEVVIVRQIHFAPFILLGTIIGLIIN
ncbi:hypothetical protein I6U48_25055 [Clostridium sp. PL3]|uniref:Prepilin type IV endopeptidase peptidase domain-containing protein n=1 Tax=Clostridium thailandense TaxID=2794346 RepID=A0A949U0L8_9CLOT|nr:hypothetical protein [Clostridium thailandense]MBV7276158.1 hypothetical protein [Clostridium thailandense]